MANRWYWNYWVLKYPCEDSTIRHFSLITHIPCKCYITSSLLRNFSDLQEKSFVSIYSYCDLFIVLPRFLNEPPNPKIMVSSKYLKLHQNTFLSKNQNTLQFAAFPSLLGIPEKNIMHGRGEVLDATYEEMSQSTFHYA